MAKTLCIIINWNAAADTNLLVEQVWKTTNAHIALIDNGSTDQSKEQLMAACSRLQAVNWQSQFECKSERLQLISSATNDGFAKAINKVIRCVLPNTYDFIWLLNNDAMPEEKALMHLEDCLLQQKDLGFAGSVIMDYEQRNKIQCCAVRYHPFFAVSKLQFKNQQWDDTKDYISNDKHIFQHGASLLVRYSMLEQLGLLDERFFLYAEEHDWQVRATKLGFGNALVVKSKVYHKGSMSTANAHHLFYYYYNTSAMKFAYKYHSFLLRTWNVIALLGITIIRTKGNMKALYWGVKGILLGYFKPNQYANL
jgi:GT2 family glycosyltransferase